MKKELKRLVLSSNSIFKICCFNNLPDFLTLTHSLNYSPTPLEIVIESPCKMFLSNSCYSCVKYFLVCIMWLLTTPPSRKYFIPPPPVSRKSCCDPNKNLPAKTSTELPGIIEIEYLFISVMNAMVYHRGWFTII